MVQHICIHVHPNPKSAILWGAGKNVSVPGTELCWCQRSQVASQCTNPLLLSLMREKKVKFWFGTVQIRWGKVHYFNYYKVNTIQRQSLGLNMWFKSQRPNQYNACIYVWGGEPEFFYQLLKCVWKEIGKVKQQQKKLLVSTNHRVP